MTDRRTFVGFAAAGLLGLSLASHAQQSGKVWRIGFLSNTPRPADAAVPAQLRQALQALGYTEGKNIAYEGRWADTGMERLAALAAELRALKVGLIVTLGGPAAAAAKQASMEIPVIVVNAGDVVESGLVTSLGHPGGSLTGISDQSEVLSAKRLELLKEVVPAATRIAVLWNADDRAMTLRYRAIEKAAQVLRVSILPLGVREPDDFDGALKAMGKWRPDALMMVSDSLTNLNRQRVIDYAAAQRIPAMYEFDSLVQGGGLMSYGSDTGENFRIAADYVDRVLKGAKAGELPVQQPDRYYLVINLKTAKALGISIPLAVLLRAAEVIR